MPQAFCEENGVSLQQNLSFQQNDQVQTERNKKHWAKSNALAKKHRAESNALAKKQRAESNELAKRQRTEANELARKHRAESNELARKHRAELNELARKHRAELNESAKKHTKDTVMQGVSSKLNKNQSDAKTIASSPNQTVQSGVSNSSHIESIKKKTEKLKRIMPAVPEYLYETASFTGAVSTVWTDMTASTLGTKELREKYDEFYTASLNYRSMAEMQLVYANRAIKNNNVDKARQYIDKYHRYIKLFNLSNQGAIATYQGNIESSREFAKGIYEGSKAAAAYGANMVPGPWASSVVDGVFTVTDFAVDGTDIGFSGASKKAISKVIAKTILDHAKFDELGGKSFSQALDEGITGAIGSSKLYSIMNKSLQSPELQKQLMSVLARSASYGGRKLTEEQATKLIYAITNSKTGAEMQGD